jgi:pyruvate,orthophosphate dikinase
VSVRSGAAISMPGMMDTILNLGLNDDTVAALATKTENERFAYDSYRRFVQMYGDVVLGVRGRSSST